MNKPTLITLLQDSCKQLVRTVEAVPEDKLAWRPLDNGRPIIDLLGETAQTLGFATDVARTRGEAKPTREMFHGWSNERAGWTREFALQQLNEGIEKLLAAIEELSEEELAQDVTMPMHGGVTMSLAGWIMMAHRTLVSRYAQINYIQTLYGDFDFH